MQVHQSVKKRSRPERSEQRPQQVQVPRSTPATGGNATDPSAAADASSILQHVVAGVKQHGHAWKLHLVSLIEQSENLASSSATHRSPVVEGGFNAHHAIHMLQPARSDEQVLLVGGFVIVVLSAGWAIFWLVTQHGREMRDLKLVLLCVSFCATSWGMNVVNKSLVETLRAPALVTGAQMSMTVICSVIMSRSRFRGGRSEVLKWSPVPIIFCGMLLSSFLTYKYLTLSMLVIVRNLGPLIVLPIETYCMPADKRPCVTYQMLLALLVLLCGAFIYCTTIQVSFRGLTFAVLNLVLAIADRVVQRRLLTNECQSLSTESCMFLNNALGLIPTLIMGVYLGELTGFDWQLWFASSTAALLLLSGIIGSGICYFALATQREIAGTSFMVLQNAVRMAVVGVGVVVFHDPIGWPFQIGGLALSFFGALWYGKSLLDGKAQKSAISAAYSKQANEPTKLPEINNPHLIWDRLKLTADVGA